MTPDHRSTHAAGTALPTSAPMLRQTNLSLVLRHLRDHHSQSRADIAEATGLHRATVSNLVAELLDRRLVRETGTEHAGAIGRPRRPVTLHGAHVGALGLEINVDYISAHGSDLSGRVLVERRIAFDAIAGGPDLALRQLGRVALEAVEAMKTAEAPPAGLGVAVPGLVDVTSMASSRLAPTWAGTIFPWPRGSRQLSDRGAFPSRSTTTRTSRRWPNTPPVSPPARPPRLPDGRGRGGRRHRPRRKLLRGADGFSGEVGHLPVDQRRPAAAAGGTAAWRPRWDSPHS